MKKTTALQKMLKKRKFWLCQARMIVYLPCLFRKLGIRQYNAADMDLLRLYLDCRIVD